MRCSEKVAALVEVLQKVQAKRYHEPNSDHYEYCGGCGNSPYNVPKHKAGCLVPEIARILKEVGA